MVVTTDRSSYDNFVLRAFLCLARMMQYVHLQSSECLTPLAGGEEGGEKGGFTGSGSTCVDGPAEVDGVVVGDVDGVVEPSFLSPTIVVGGLEIYAPPTKMWVTSASVTGTSS